MTPGTREPGRAPFLLEIGSEEIPARFIPDAMAELEARLVGALREAHLQAEGVRTLATPRRMALLIDALSLEQPDRELVIKGPPVSVAFGPDGAPTPAGRGLRPQGRRRPGRLRPGHRPAGRIPGGPPHGAGSARRRRSWREAVPAAVLGVPFRKVMRWGDHDVEYPRPLQWIVALLGGEVVPLQVDYLAAGRTSRGHRTLAGDRPVEIAAPRRLRRGPACRRGGGGPRRAPPADRRAATRPWWPPGIRRPACWRTTSCWTEVVFLCEHPTPVPGRATPTHTPSCRPR